MNNTCKHIILFSVLSCLLSHAVAQGNEHKKDSITFSGYLEVYYVYSFNRPQDHTLPPFIYNYNRTEEVNINLAFFKVNYDARDLRANFAIAAGTYMNANYAAEPGVLKNIYEADAGVKILKNRDLWVDAGIMPSHIGFESAVGKDNLTLSRSIVAENTPYYETGVKLGYTNRNGKWYIAILYLNGWQNIQRSNGSNSPAVGTQVTRTASPEFTLNYSTFAGKISADTIKQMRYYNDLYGIFNLNKNWSIEAGIDDGLQQEERSKNKYDSWYAPVLIVCYSPFPKVKLAARAEYFNDKHNAMIAAENTTGFRTTGFSFNADYDLSSQAIWRIEIRNFSSKEELFINKENNFVNKDAIISTALSIAF